MATKKTYSTDFREIVIAKVNEGILQLKDIAKFFNVNVKTIFDWRKQFEKTGTLSPKIGYQKGHSHKITNLDEFKIFVENNPDLTQKEMSQRWNNVSPKTIERALKKIDFTRKKNNSATKNVMKKNEQNFKKK